MNETLFETQPNQLARRTRPRTSKQAARGIVEHLSNLETWAIHCIEQSPGLTQREFGAQYCPDDSRRIGRRLSKLWERGRIRRGQARPCSISGRPAYTWWPNEPKG